MHAKWKDSEIPTMMNYDRISRDGKNTLFA